MINSRFKFMLVSLGLLLAVLLVQALVTREPACEGRKLGVWLQEYDHGDSKAADSAVQQMGADALPELKHMLRAHDSAFKKKLMQLAQKQSVIKFQFANTGTIRERAVRACAALGPAARPAIPELGEAVGHGSGSAIRVLEKFGPEAISALATALTNAPGCSPPYSTALALGRMGANARLAVTNLVWEFEHYSVGYPRWASAVSAARISRDLIARKNEPYAPEVLYVKAALLRGLSGTNVNAPAHAAEALGELGTYVQEATPSLLGLLNHPTQRVRECATNALKSIAPEQLVLATTHR